MSLGVLAVSKAHASRRGPPLLDRIGHIAPPAPKQLAVLGALNNQAFDVGGNSIDIFGFDQCIAETVAHPYLLDHSRI